MSSSFDVTAIGNAIVDVIAPADDAFLAAQALVKGSMGLIDDERAASLYGAMAAAIETSGGSGANTAAGVASFGARAAYIGKVAPDQLGEVFAHDMRAIGVDFDVAPLTGGPATGRSLINVTPDGERTMATFLGASNQLTADDVKVELIEASQIVFLEGYLFDPSEARRAFAKAAAIARGCGRTIAFTLSDSFVVERHREALLDFIDGQVDVVFANEAEITALFQTTFDEALDALAFKSRMACVTRGEQGSVITQGADRFAIPIYPVETLVDTTGAGDQYAAGVLYGLARGLPLDHCGRLGALAASEVISHYGPRPQVSLARLASEKGL
jgi:sugar/nucleoside kinase (ribokinase family)